MAKLLYIFLGSGVGGVLRYVVSGWAQRAGGSGFPIGTWLVNILGCLLIGFLSATFAVRLVREEYRIALMVGVLGGLTTFSTFSLETFSLVNEGQIARAVLNVLSSVLVGVAAVWLGYRLAEGWLGA